MAPPRTKSRLGRVGALGIIKWAHSQWKTTGLLDIQALLLFVRGRGGEGGVVCVCVGVLALVSLTRLSLVLKRLFDPLASVVLRGADVD